MRGRNSGTVSLLAISALSTPCVLEQAIEAYHEGKIAMRRNLTLALALSCFQVTAADKFELAVCNAISDTASKQECLSELKQRDTIKQRKEEAYAASEARRKAQRELYGEQCGTDFDCWVKSRTREWTFDKDAYSPCISQIEASARYQARWVDNWGELKFPKYFKPGSTQGYHSHVIGYGGDMIELQNGFGAWQRHSYICWFDTVSNKILSIEITPGRNRFSHSNNPATTH